MTACAGCGTDLTFSVEHGWCDAKDRPFCGPGERAWHQPVLSAEEIAADAEAFVAELRSTAAARDRFNT